MPGRRTRSRRFRSVGAVFLGTLLAVFLWRWGWTSDGTKAQANREDVPVAERSATTGPRTPSAGPRDDSVGRERVAVEGGEESVADMRSGGDPAPRVFITDEMGRAVFGAEVHLLTSAASELLGASNQDGMLPLPAAEYNEDEGRLWLLASKENLCPKRVPLRLGANGEIHVTLRRSCTLSGVILDPEGMPVPAGVSVLALGGEMVLGGDDFVLVQAGLPLASMALTDDMGQFVLEGLRTSCPYQLYAGGKGYIRSDMFPPTFVAGETEYMELTAYHLYALMIRLRQEDGRPLTLPGGYRSSWRGSPKVLAAQAGVVFSGGWTAGLAGLGKAMPDQEGAIDILLMCESRGSRLPELPVEYSVRVPGYVEHREMLAVPEFTGGVSVRRIPLVRESLERGTLLLMFSPVDAGRRFVDCMRRSVLSCVVTLEGADGSSIRVRVDGKDLGAEDGFVVTGIPCGDYSIVFEGPHYRFQYPLPGDAPLRVAVRVGINVVTVPIDGYGTLAIAVRDGDGNAYGGHLSGSLVRSEDGIFLGFSFAEDPYVLPLVPPGAYEVGVDSPVSGAGRIQGPREVVIEPSRTSEITVHLDW